MRIVKEFARFVRPAICLVFVLIALSGYFLVNEPTIRMFFLIPAALFLTATTYSFNNITDVKEDYINNGFVDYFSNHEYLGRIFITLFILLGSAFAMALAPFARYIYFLLIFLGVAYSAYKTKSVFFVKNFYTAFGVSGLFFIGIASEGTNLTLSLIIYTLTFAIFIIIGSMLSDLRDYIGDKKAGIKTLPVIIGKESSKILILYFIILTSLLIAIMQLDKLLIFSLVNPLIFWLMFKDYYKASHHVLMTTLAVLPGWLLMIG